MVPSGRKTLVSRLNTSQVTDGYVVVGESSGSPENDELGEIFLDHSRKARAHLDQQSVNTGGQQASFWH